MSVLDKRFKILATRGLPVQQAPLGGEDTVEPGFLYKLLGQRLSGSASAIVGLAAHPVADVVGKRFGLKVVAYDEPLLNMPLHVTTPDGQFIEGLDGVLADFVDLGTQEIGSYHEWICDPDGNWLLISKPPHTMPAGQIVIQGIPIVIQGAPVVVSVD